MRSLDDMSARPTDASAKVLNADGESNSGARSRADWTHWNEENEAAIKAYNERIERDGLPLAHYRGFMRDR